MAKATIEFYPPRTIAIYINDTTHRAWQQFWMAKYHFGSVDGQREPDPDGVELQNDEAAQAYAITYAGEVLASDPGQLWAHGQWRVEVTDDAGVLLFTVITLAIDAPRPKAG